MKTSKKFLPVFEYPHLPSDIFTQLGVIFSNSTNRILACQYPYDVEQKTIYTKKPRYEYLIKEELSKLVTDTLLIVRDKQGDLIDTYFLPIEYSKYSTEENLSREKLPPIDERIPLNFIK